MFIGVIVAVGLFALVSGMGFWIQFWFNKFYDDGWPELQCLLMALAFPACVVAGIITAVVGMNAGVTP